MGVVGSGLRPVGPDDRRAYQAYIAHVHPWIDTIEPRTADLDWLTALVPDLVN